MLEQLRAFLKETFSQKRPGRVWQRRTLVVGPAQPVDGDSVSCVKALIDHLRHQKLEAYTLPTRVMYKQLEWILDQRDFYSAATMRTTDDLQAAYDQLLRLWTPAEIVLVDGPLSQLGFDPRGVKVYTIDHHVVDGVTRDDDDAYIQPAPSAGCLLIDRFEIYDPILAVSILTDTFWLRQNKPAQASRFLAKLTYHGLSDEMLMSYQRAMTVRKDPLIIKAMNEADVQIVGETACLVLKTADAEIHRGVMGELGYFCANLCVVRADGYVSMKVVDPSLDLRPLARKFGGGGHANMAAGHLAEVNADVVETLFREFIQTVSR
jgi:nanoRNase/pAp phosphatase (c-di-AMP/oligoRNAs hydrolase)